jgi:nucleoside-diphosphate-sugar epimerase/CBS domain-containing protein
MKTGLALISGTTSIKESIQLIARSRQDTAFVLSESGKYKGAVSINDLRRLLISGVNELDQVGGHPCAHRSSVRRADLKNESAVRNILADLVLEGIEHIPVLDDDDAILEVLSRVDLEQLSAKRQSHGAGNGHLRRILIVGGAGYLGSVLSAKLLARGYAVRILDNFLYGRRSLESIRNSPSLEVIEGDLRNIHTCVSALDDVHAVILLAAIVGDPASKVRPRETIETNVIAAQALAAACKLQCINRFLYASTCSVYGLGENLLDEEAELRPVSLYARTKIASEKTILAMGDEYFAPTVLRMGTLYGWSSRMRFDLVVNTMTMNAFTERKIRVFGGKQWRPLLSVEDAAHAYVACIEADITRVGNQVFNIGSDEQNYQIEDIAGIIAGNFRGVDVQHDGRSLDVRDYRVTFRKAHEVLGFRPADSVQAASQKIHSSLANGLIPDPSLKIYYNHFFDATEE